jgi:hypothetical protein
LEENKVNALLTSSLTTSPYSIASSEVDTCYGVIGNAIRIGQRILEISHTDTASVQDASKVNMQLLTFEEKATVEDGYTIYPSRQQVRVIIGEFGTIVRMSAPSLDIVSEGSSRNEAWTKFLEEIRRRDDAAWLTFDVGPTRHEEIAEGLNAPEDEDWSEHAEDVEG